LLSGIEALLLHGETRPMTGLPARATSAASERSGRYAVGIEANRSLWPDFEFHEKSLPAMPALLFSRVQTYSSISAIQLTRIKLPQL
jgi:hypothetical protein